MTIIVILNCVKLNKKIFGLANHNNADDLYSNTISRLYLIVKEFGNSSHRESIFYSNRVIPKTINTNVLSFYHLR